MRLLLVRGNNVIQLEEYFKDYIKMQMRLLIVR